MSRRHVRLSQGSAALVRQREYLRAALPGRHEVRLEHVQLRMCRPAILLSMHRWGKPILQYHD